MKVIIFQLVLTLLILDTQAQKVSNIRAEQRGQDIVVLYLLEVTTPCEVNLLLSQDNGATWSAPLKIVSGDVGKNISAGEKQITWKVLEEQESLIGDKMKFKVVINGRKNFEPEMILVEGGTFKMGYNYGKTNEKPVHTVTLSAFKIGKYEVTQAQWKAIMGENPSGFDECLNCPIQNVTWNEVGAFVNKLNAQTDKRYRLPTEAEWEFAARGGKKTKGYNFSGGDDIISVAWFSENSYSKTHSVGLKLPNELGIYDMTGNVWEYCSDWLGDYDIRVIVNPSGSNDGEFRVVRGGSFGTIVSDSRITCRTGVYAGDKYLNRGFRLALDVEE
jgi:formylglycine-generating enzyme required for sulfatase activity